MKKRENNTLSGILPRTFACVISGAIVSIVLLANLDTYSWFISNTDSGIQVKAAATEDILSKIEVNMTNPTAITLKKTSGKAAPSIFFSVEGEAAQYIRPLNPLKLDTDSEKSLPISVAFSLEQLMKLMSDSNIQKIQGKIHINYLNEYINEQRDIEFTKDYLINKAWINIFGNASSLEVPYNSNNNLKKLVEYIGSFKPNKNALVVAADTPVYSAGTADAAQYQIPVPAQPFAFTKDEAQVVDLVVPQLRSYIYNLYTTNNYLINSLKEKADEISKLNLELEQAKADNDALKAQFAALLAEIEKLENENINLKAALDALQPETIDGNGVTDTNSTPSAITVIQQPSQEAVSDQSEPQTQDINLSEAEAPTP